MNKRMEKKKQKQQAYAPAAAPAPAAPVFQPDFYIQYQDKEYTCQEICEKVRALCKENGASDGELSSLSIYLKPEDKKAYFAYGEKNGFLDL